MSDPIDDLRPGDKVFVKETTIKLVEASESRDDFKDRDLTYTTLVSVKAEVHPNALAGEIEEALS